MMKRKNKKKKNLVTRNLNFMKVSKQNAFLFYLFQDCGLILVGGIFIVLSMMILSGSGGLIVKKIFEYG